MATEWRTLTHHSAISPVSLGSGKFRYVYAVSSTPASPQASPDQEWIYGRNILMLGGPTGGLWFGGGKMIPNYGAGTSDYNETWSGTHVKLEALDSSYLPVGSPLLQMDYDWTMFGDYNAFRGFYIDVRGAQAMTRTKNSFTGAFYGLGIEYYGVTSGVQSRSAALMNPIVYAGGGTVEVNPT